MQCSDIMSLPQVLLDLLVIGRYLFKALGLVCILIAVSLISVTLYIYFNTVMPLIIDIRSVSGILSFIPASWISFNLLFNYAMVVCTAPGSPKMTVSPEEAAKLASEPTPAKGVVCVPETCATCRGITLMTDAPDASGGGIPVLMAENSPPSTSLQ